MNLISVVIPAKEHDIRLEKAIRSALEQTLPPLEVIVCDNGSTNGRVEIMASIQDHRIRWIDGGTDGLPSIPKNRGVITCRGDWVAFLDSDDIWLPGKLEKQIKFAKESGCAAICTNAVRFIPGYGSKGNLLTHGATLGTRLSFQTLLRNNNVICSSVLIKKDLLCKARGFPENRELIVGEDYSLWLRTSTMTDFAFLNEALLIYNDEPASSIRAYSPPPLQQKKYVLMSFLSWAWENGAKKTYIHSAQRLLLWIKIVECVHRIKSALTK